MPRLSSAPYAVTIGVMLLRDLSVDPDALAARTGWTIKPEGVCKAEVCVPLPADAGRADGRIDARVLADRLGMALVADEAHGLWALGPETTVTGRALTTAVAPDLTLPDARRQPVRAVEPARAEGAARRVGVVVRLPF